MQVEKFCNACNEVFVVKQQNHKTCYVCLQKQRQMKNCPVADCDKMIRGISVACTAHSYLFRERTYEPLQPRIEKQCKGCDKKYLARQHNSKFCDSCRFIQNERILCKCGCGKSVKKIKGYHGTCLKRGKTYSEIYGTKTPKCGFKKGKENPNYTRSKFTGCTLSNSRREKFRSSLEVQFSEFCIKNNIEYKSEVRVLLNNGKLKIVDFVLDNLIYVEISGFAYPKWQKDFVDKMKILRQTIDNPILILTYKKHLDSNSGIFKINISRDLFFEDIHNEDRILKKIQMFKLNTYINEKILQSCK